MAVAIGTATPSTAAVVWPEPPPTPNTTPAHDDRHVQLVDELLEVERLAPAGHVLGRDRGAADDEDVHPGVDDRLVVAGRPLGRQPRRGGHAGRADLLDPPADQLVPYRRGVHLLQPPGGGLLVPLVCL